MGEPFKTYQNIASITAMWKTNFMLLLGFRVVKEEATRGFLWKKSVFGNLGLGLQIY